MKRLFQRAAAHLKMPGRLGSLQIVGCIVGVNAVAALGHDVGNIATSAITDCIGGQILQGIPTFAAISGGGLDLGSLTSQVVASTIGALLTIILSILWNLRPQGPLSEAEALSSSALPVSRQQ